MIIEIIFIFTAAMVISLALKMLGAVFGNSITLPIIIPFTNITPAYHIIMYPSLMFQIWFWAERLGVFLL